MQRAEDLVFVHTSLCLLSRQNIAYKYGPNHIWDVDSIHVGDDRFDLLDKINLGRLEFKNISLDEHKLEAIMFDVATENDVEDDAINILTCRYECYL